MKEEQPAAELIVGVNPILEQLRHAPHAIRRILFAEGATGGAARVVAVARAAGVHVDAEDPRRLRKLAGGIVHQGVVAEVGAFGYTAWSDLLAVEPNCLVALDQVTDPRNLGAVIRSAEAAGLGGVILPERRSAGVNSTVAKASAGASARLPVTRVPNLVRALEDLKRQGLWVVGLDGEAPQSLFGFRFPDRVVFVVGSEGRGLRPLVRSSCDHRVAIPMLGRVASLNISVAAAIAFYEWIRQRQLVDTPTHR
jgi:23S rRNA (guanosine2251-2'-O)-methyltransferase